jgi:hypothetical protein
MWHLFFDLGRLINSEHFLNNLMTGEANQIILNVVELFSDIFTKPSVQTTHPKLFNKKNLENLFRFLNNVNVN